MCGTSRLVILSAAPLLPRSFPKLASQIGGEIEQLALASLRKLDPENREKGGKKNDIPT